MKIADVSSTHSDNDLDSQMKIILISFVIKDISHDNENTYNIIAITDMNNHECDKCKMVTRKMTTLAQA